MSEETLDDVYGEAAPQETSPETTEEETTQDVVEEATEETQEDNDTVPYSRFSEVNNKFRETENEATALRQELDQLKAEQAPEETPQFETADDLIQYQDDKTTGKIDQSMKSQNAMWEAKLEANNKMNELERNYPEIKEDAMFADLISQKIKDNPSLDIGRAAKEVKTYLKTYEERGRKTAEEKLVERGGFQGGVAGNQPMQQTDADKDYAQKIVDMSGGVDSTF